MLHSVRCLGEDRGGEGVGMVGGAEVGPEGDDAVYELAADEVVEPRWNIGKVSINVK